MLKKHFLNKTKTVQVLVTVLVVAVVAGIGTYLLTGSHAATPYSSITADSGQLASGAVKQSCSGATDGDCVAFEPTNNGGGGGTIGGGSSMVVGMNAGGWGPSGAADASKAVQYIRLDVDDGEPVSDFSSNGAKVDVLFSGDMNNTNINNFDAYNTGGVSAINISGWVTNALAYYKSQCTPTECPMLEVLNEPDGSWFWGTNANDTTNADAYAKLLQATYAGFHTAYCGGATIKCSNAPLILATYSNSPWGPEWWNYDESALGPSSSYVDGVVEHPYGGGDTTNYAASAAGDEAQVATAHANTGEPVYVTEVGWPTDDSGPSPTTANSTGDSDQWPLADSAGNSQHGLDQCDNVYNFISWTRSTDYVNAVYIYGYINAADTGGAQYGVETHALVHKPAYYSLQAAAENKANPCPSASNNYTLQSN
jgi:hypothetical protein